MFKRLKDIVTGKVASENILIQNHLVNIVEKIRNSDDRVLFALINSLAGSTMHFLEHMYGFNEQDAKSYLKTPFREPVHKNVRESSYTVFKWVAGLFYSNMISDDLFPEAVHTEDLQTKFFSIYDYDERDKRIFVELRELLNTRDNDNLTWVPVMNLYEHIYEEYYEKPYPTENASFVMSSIYSFISIYKETLPSMFVNFLNLFDEGHKKMAN